METAVEDKFLELHKTVINKWRDTAFPIGVKDDGAAHKEALQSLLFAPDLMKILAGFALLNINLWLTRPWLMPALQLWFQILVKYEGANLNSNMDFIQ
eukprot:1150672-Rhodomonas_salina.1